MWNLTTPPAAETRLIVRLSELPTVPRVLNNHRDERRFKLTRRAQPLGVGDRTSKMHAWHEYAWLDYRLRGIRENDIPTQKKNKIIFSPSDDEQS